MPGPVFPVRPLRGNTQTVLLWALSMLSFSLSVSNMGVCSGEPPHQLAEPRHGSHTGDKQDLFMGPYHPFLVPTHTEKPPCPLPAYVDLSLKLKADFPTAPSRMSWFPGCLLSWDWSLLVLGGSRWDTACLRALFACSSPSNTSLTTPLTFHPQVYMNAVWHGWAIPMFLFLAILRLSLNYLIAR